MSGSSLSGKSPRVCNVSCQQRITAPETHSNELQASPPQLQLKVDISDHLLWLVSPFWLLASIIFLLG